MSDIGNQLQNTPARPVARPETHQERAARWQAVERRYAEADVRAAALSRDVFQPLLREFQEVLESDGILVHGIPQQGHDSNGAHWACYTAADAVSRKQSYSIRLAAQAYRDGPLVLSADCRHDPARLCRRRRAKTPLAGFAPDANTDTYTKTLEDCRIDDDAARQWCEGILKRAAAAIIDAVFVAVPGRAPVTAFPQMEIPAMI